MADDENGDEKKEKYVVQFPLVVESWQQDYLERDFNFITSIYDFAVKKFVGRYTRMLKKEYPEYSLIINYFKDKSYVARKKKMYENSKEVLATGKSKTVQIKKKGKTIDFEITVEIASNFIPKYEEKNRRVEPFQSINEKHFRELALSLNQKFLDATFGEQPKRAGRKPNIEGARKFRQEQRDSLPGKKFESLCKTLLELIRDSTIINDYEIAEYSSSYAPYSFGGKDGINSTVSCWGENLALFGDKPNLLGLSSDVLKFSVGKPLTAAFKKKFDNGNILMGIDCFIHQKEENGKLVECIVFPKPKPETKVESEEKETNGKKKTSVGAKINMAGKTISIPIDNYGGKICMPFKDSNDKVSEQFFNTKIKDIKDVRILRKMMSGKVHYYVSFTCNGKPYDKGFKLGTGVVGIDVGPSTITISASGRKVKKYNLRDKKAIEVEEKIKYHQRRQARSEMLSNPDCYDEKHARIEDKKATNHSKRYFREVASIQELERKYTKSRDIEYHRLAHEIMKYGNKFIVENNNVSEWQENGYGKSILRNAPARFISILKDNVLRRGGEFYQVNCGISASQFDFTNKTFTHHDVKVREVTLSNGITVDRDLNAAFNLEHVNLSKAPLADKKTAKHNIKQLPEYYNVSEMESDFEKFLASTKNNA